MPRRLLPVLALVVLLAGVRGAAAQTPGPRLSPTAQSLQTYLLTRADLPPGFRIVGQPEETNNEQAAASDPDQAELIRKWGRITQIDQSLERARPEALIDVSVTLMRDAEGAWGDALESTFPPGVQVEQTLPGPPAGERSVGFSYRLGALPDQIQIHVLVFQRDRLEVGITLVTFVDQGELDDILPLAQAVDAKIIASPPGPVTADELALIEEPTPAVLVRGAVRLLAARFIRPLEVDELLTEAWQGAAEALTRAGVPDVPAPPAYPEDEESAIALHMHEFRILENLAVGRLTPRQLAYAAINELVERRDDCHTAHIPPERWRQLKAQDAGQPVVLIGVTFAPDSPVRIIATSPNGPARAAGLRPGQVVIAINGVNVESMTVTEARALINSTEGVPNVFTVRNPSGIVQEITAAPGRFTVPTMESEIVDDIGILRFYSFQPGTEQLQRMRAALEDFEAQGVRGWLIDLRNNNDGFELTSIQMTSLFVEGGRLFGRSQRGRPVSWAEATGNVLPFQRPLVFLVGPASYSAAEIFPGALQARGRAVLVGERTGGCIGATRSGNGLLDGSALNVTEREIVIGPDGHEYRRVGVPPNFEVESPSPEDVEAGRDPQLAEAIQILRQLIGPDSPKIPAPPATAPRQGVLITV